MILLVINGDDFVADVLVVIGGATLGLAVSGFTTCMPIDSGTLLEDSFVSTTELVLLAIDPLLALVDTEVSSSSFVVDVILI